MLRTTRLCRRPGRPPVSGWSDAQKVISIVAKGGDKIKRQELRQATESEKRLLKSYDGTDTYIWSHNVRHSFITSYHKDESFGRA